MRRGGCTYTKSGGIYHSTHDMYIPTFILSRTGTQWIPSDYLFGCFLDRCDDCGEVQFAALRPDSKPRLCDAAYLVRSRVSEVHKLNVVYKMILLSFNQKTLTGLVKVM
jgi:hypothetical protein